MSDYFKYFPNVKYDGKVLADITRKNQVIERLKHATYTFLPYTIEDGMRPEDIAYYYYGDVRYTWLLFVANEIVDPYYEWPMSYDDLYKTIGMKYRRKYFEEEANTTLYSSERDIPLEEVVYWTQDTTVNNNIVEYRSISNSDIRLSKDSFVAPWDNQVVQTDFYEFRYYDYEMERNENNRHIFVISKDYAAQVLSDHKELMDE